MIMPLFNLWAYPEEDRAELGMPFSKVGGSGLKDIGNTGCGRPSQLGTCQKGKRSRMPVLYVVDWVKATSFEDATLRNQGTRSSEPQPRGIETGSRFGLDSQDPSTRILARGKAVPQSFDPAGDFHPKRSQGSQLAAKLASAARHLEFFCAKYVKKHPGGGR